MPVSYTHLDVYKRQDLYAQLGYPELNDYDTDLLEVLKQMQDLESENADGEKVYLSLIHI